MLNQGRNYSLIREGTGNAVLRQTPIPRLRPDYILVRVVAVALNPTDWTTLDAPGQDGTIVGCDYSGVAEEVGSEVKRDFKPGERVAGFAHGANDANFENGAFARYIAVKGDLQMHIPDDVSFEAAATTGVGVGTAGYALFKVLGLPWPEPVGGKAPATKDDAEPILVYGGSTATGTLAIQFVKLAGRKVVTTCSPRHAALVKERGADFVYDYRMEGVGEQIRKDTAGRISKVLDTVSLEATASICASAIGPAGGTYCNLLDTHCPRSDVDSIFFLGYSMSGEEYIFESQTYAAKPEDFVFGVKWYELAEKLWAHGCWVPHPLRLEQGGLGGITNGLQLMRDGEVSGEKLVYRVEETVWPEY